MIFRNHLPNTTMEAKRFVSHYFFLSQSTIDYLKSLKEEFGFNGLGGAVFYRTYSRAIMKESFDYERIYKRIHPEGTQEDWADCVIRVVEGVISIRKDFLLKNELEWNDEEWQEYAREFADYMYHMRFLPPGRGLYACGTDYMYTRGAAACYNCASVETTDLVKSATWTMDMLMCGAGVGFDTSWNGKVLTPNKQDTELFQIPDSREGWVEALGRMLKAYVEGGKFPVYDYSLVRAKGLPIKGFGGIASGPEPLRKLLRRVEAYMDAFVSKGDKEQIFEKLLRDLREEDSSWMQEKEFEEYVEKVKSTCKNNEKQYSITRVVVDIFNAIGACVVAGNIRRSSEIALGEPEDKVFLHLKDYTMNPERQVIGWCSNNSLRLTKTEDFHMLPEIAKRMADNGEPGIFNLLNVKRYGRVGHRKEEWTREYEEDQATVCNPCGEICNCSYEVCNLSEIFPTRCLDSGNKFSEEVFFKATRFATFYSSTISLLPTHRIETNKIIAKNRRIGVSLSGIADFYDTKGMTELTRLIRLGYKEVRQENIKKSRRSRSSTIDTCNMYQA